MSYRCAFCGEENDTQHCRDAREAFIMRRACGRDGRRRLTIATGRNFLPRRRV